MSISDYQILEKCGYGSFGRCFDAVEKTTSRAVVIKFIPKSLIKAQNLQKNVRAEVQTHIRLKHPNIVELYTTFEDKKNVYLVMEPCSKGELYKYIKLNGRLNEEEARRFFGELVNGLRYLHLHNIVHRDLKLSNLLLTNDMILKIADFGLVTMAPEAEKTMMCGTPNYVSPEMVKGEPYGLETDLWSLGCILYTFIVGKSPFEAASVDATLDKIRRIDYEIPSWVAEDARDLIRRLLVEIPDRRIALNDILQHQYLHRQSSSSSMNNHINNNINNNGSASQLIQHSSGLIEFTNRSVSSSNGGGQHSSSSNMHNNNNQNNHSSFSSISVGPKPAAVHSPSSSSISSLLPTVPFPQHHHIRDSYSADSTNLNVSFQSSSSMIDADECLQSALNSSDLPPCSQSVPGSNLVMAILPNGEGSLVSIDGVAQVNVAANGLSMVARRTRDNNNGNEDVIMIDPIMRDNIPPWCGSMVYALAKYVCKVKGSTPAVVYRSLYGKGQLMRQAYIGALRSFVFKGRQGSVVLSMSVLVGVEQKLWDVKKFRCSDNEISEEKKQWWIDCGRQCFDVCIRLEQNARKFPVVAAHKDCDASMKKENSQMVRYEYRSNPPVILKSTFASGLGWVHVVNDGSFWLMMNSGDQIITSSSLASIVHTDVTGKAKRYDVADIPEHLISNFESMKAVISKRLLTQKMQ